MIEVKGNGEWIKIYFPYNLEYNTKIKSINRYRWHPEERCWSVPYSEFERLISQFDGEKLDINPSVWLYGTISPVIRSDVSFFLTRSL